GAPPAKAGCERVTVPVAVAPPAMGDGITVRPETASPATVRIPLTVFGVYPRVGTIEATMTRETVCASSGVVMVKDCWVCPDAKTSWLGVIVYPGGDPCTDK